MRETPTGEESYSRVGLRGMKVSASGEGGRYSRQLIHIRCYTNLAKTNENQDIHSQEQRVIRGNEGRDASGHVSLLDPFISISGEPANTAKMK